MGAINDSLVLDQACADKLNAEEQGQNIPVGNFNTINTDVTCIKHFKGPANPIQSNFHRAASSVGVRRSIQYLIFRPVRGVRVTRCPKNIQRVVSTPGPGPQVVIICFCIESLYLMPFC